MTKSLGIQLIVYSLLLAGLSYFLHQLAPSISRLALIAGLAGAGLSLIWGFRSVFGKRGKALSILTLIPVCFVMLSQTVLIWGGGNQEVPGQRTSALVITAMFALSVGMLMRIAYAGVVFDGPPGSRKEDRGASIQTGSGLAARPQGDNRA
jgi:hypothetical protein